MKSNKTLSKTNSMENKEPLQKKFLENSGGTRRHRWTPEEEKTLKELCIKYCYGSGYDYQSISEELNNMYGHERSADACRTRYCFLKGEYDILSDHNPSVKYPKREFRKKPPFVEV